MVDHAHIERMATLLKTSSSIRAPKAVIRCRAVKVIGIASQQSDIDFHKSKTSTLPPHLAPHDRRPV